MISRLHWGQNWLEALSIRTWTGDCGQCITKEGTHGKSSLHNRMLVAVVQTRSAHPTWSWPAWTWTLLSKALQICFNYQQANHSKSLNTLIMLNTFPTNGITKISSYPSLFHSLCFLSQDGWSNNSPRTSIGFILTGCEQLVNLGLLILCEMIWTIIAS